MEAGRVPQISWSEHLDAQGRPHWSRHLEANGIDRVTAKAIIERDVLAKIAGAEFSLGLNLVSVIIQSRQVRYTAYVFSDERVNVGRSIVLE